MQRLRYSGGMVWAKTGEGAASTNGGIPCANAVLYAYSTNELNLGCSEKRTYVLTENVPLPITSGCFPSSTLVLLLRTVPNTADIIQRVNLAYLKVLE